MSYKTYKPYTSNMSYRDLKSYQQTVVIHDFTVKFVDCYIPKASRTRDQMEQAARSGKQNIVEGSSERTSKKSELFLLGVARASLEELLADYEDFLRQKGLELWEKEDSRSVTVRNIYKTDKSYKIYMSYLDEPEAAANCMVCLINQTNFLLDRQIKSLEEKFVKEGDYNEILRKRREEQKKRDVVYGRKRRTW